MERVEIVTDIFRCADLFSKSVSMGYTKGFQFLFSFLGIAEHDLKREGNLQKV